MALGGRKGSVQLFSLPEEVRCRRSEAGSSSRSAQVRP